MKKIICNYLYASIVTLLFSFSGISSAEQNELDFLSGYFSREGNSEKVAEATNNNIYIKFYPEQWIAILYVPYPYAATVNHDTINLVFKKVNRSSEGGSFTRSDFGLLNEAATVHVEKYKLVIDQFQFKCGSITPCAIRFSEDYLELVKSGIINEHIIKFDHLPNKNLN